MAHALKTIGISVAVSTAMVPSDSFCAPVTAGDRQIGDIHETAGSGQFREPLYTWFSDSLILVQITKYHVRTSVFQGDCRSTLSSPAEEACRALL